MRQFKTYLLVGGAVLALSAAMSQAQAGTMAMPSGDGGLMNLLLVGDNGGGHGRERGVPDRKKMDQETNRILDEHFERNKGRYTKDQQEDIRDRLEDVRDAHEDKWDAQRDGGKADKLEDIHDRREDVRDSREDRKEDRREDRRDGGRGEHRGEMREKLKNELMGLPPEERKAKMDELRKEMLEKRQERRTERKEEFENKWDDATPDEREAFCSHAKEKCQEHGGGMICETLQEKCAAR
jgi:hypothetical protein